MGLPRPSSRPSLAREEACLIERRASRLPVQPIQTSAVIGAGAGKLLPRAAGDPSQSPVDDLMRPPGAVARPVSRHRAVPRPRSTEVPRPVKNRPVKNGTITPRPSKRPRGGIIIRSSIGPSLKGPQEQAHVSGQEISTVAGGLETSLRPTAPPPTALPPQELVVVVGHRPEGPRPEGPRPEGPRPEGPRPEGPRPEAVAPKAEAKTTARALGAGIGKPLSQGEKEHIPSSEVSLSISKVQSGQHFNGKQGKSVRLLRALVRRPSQPRLRRARPTKPQVMTVLPVACEVEPVQPLEVESVQVQTLEAGEVVVGAKATQTSTEVDPPSGDSVQTQLANRLNSALREWRSALEASVEDPSPVKSEPEGGVSGSPESLSLALLDLSLDLTAAAMHFGENITAQSLLQALPALLDTAAADQAPETCVQRSRRLLQRMESDKAFSEEHVRTHARSDAAADLRHLAEAMATGVRFSTRLYRIKLAKERMVLMDLLQSELDSAERRAGVCTIGLVKARASLNALLHSKVMAAKSQQEELAIVGIVGGKQQDEEHGDDAAAAVEKQPEVLASPKPLASRLLTCSLPAGPPGDAGLFRRVRALAVRLLTVQGARPSAAAAALATVLATAGRAEAVAQRRALEAQRVAVEAQRATTEELLGSPSALEEKVDRSLATGHGSLGGVEKLLQTLSDKDTTAHVKEELRKRARQEAEWDLQRATHKLASLSLELEAVTAREEEGTVEASAPSVDPEPAAAEKPCAAVSAGDWARLEEEQHLNDAVLDLFISLMTRALGGTRIHAFSSLFFSRLSSCGARDGLEGWEHVRTWTRGARRSTPAGIFACDALLVPVHHRSHHWSLAVVCRPWAAAECAATTLDLVSDGDQPPACGAEVAFLNSLGRDTETEASVLHFLRGYLAKEWADCLGRDAGNYRSEALSGVAVEVPAQQNDSDCGIFVLEFVLCLLQRQELLAALGRSPLPLDVSDVPRHRWRRAGAALRAQGGLEAGGWLRFLAPGSPVGK